MDTRFSSTGVFGILFVLLANVANAAVQSGWYRVTQPNLRYNWAGGTATVKYENGEVSCITRLRGHCIHYNPNEAGFSLSSATLPDGYATMNCSTDHKHYWGSVGYDNGSGHWCNWSRSQIENGEATLLFPLDRDGPPEPPASWVSTSEGFTRNHLRSVAYGNGKFVAVGDGGAIASSDDGGSSWELRTSGVTNMLTSVHYLNGRFVATAKHVDGDASETNKVLHSTDGIIWTVSDGTIQGGLLVSATYDGRQYVLVAGNRIYTSQDLSQFTVVDNELASGILAIYGVLYPGVPSPAVLNDIIYLRSGVYAFVGTERHYGTPRIFVGSTLATVSEIEGMRGGFHMLLFKGYSLTSVASNGDSTVVVAVTTKNLCYVSTDRGTTWDAQRIAPSNVVNYEAVDFYDVTYADGEFVASGEDTSNSRGVMFASTDGSSWTKERFVFSQRVNSVAFDGGVYVAVGANGAIYRK